MVTLQYVLYLFENYKAVLYVTHLSLSYNHSVFFFSDIFLCSKIVI